MVGSALANQRLSHHRAQDDLSQSETFPPLSLGHSDVDNECEVTLHIKVSANAHSWHFVLGLGTEYLLGT